MEMSSESIITGKEHVYSICNSHGKQCFLHIDRCPNEERGLVRGQNMPTSKQVPVPFYAINTLKGAGIPHAEIQRML
jgi:hypothetical protein